MAKYFFILLSMLTSSMLYAQNGVMDIIGANSAGPSQYTSPEEIAEYKRLADEGNIQTAGYLGDMYFFGEATVPRDCAQSL